ncbi:MAG: hypothetical protein KDB01_21810, partial [Planctomycetaceae bacterium]|nr:hypothetical protein [Planctomycetaceae bacterium]
MLEKRTRTRRRFSLSPQLIEVLEARQLLSTLQTQLPPDINSFRLTTDLNQTTPGLTGSYVNSNLRNRSVQDDWRVSQAISGTRVDAAVDFDTLNWGVRSSVGITGGSDLNWENFSVQWDGFVDVLVTGTTLRTTSDDSSRFWIDLNRDGTFDSSGAEFVDNHWGTPQATTDGNLSVPLNAGIYRIRLQYEEAGGDNVMRLKSTPPNRLRIAYLIPSNREPQPEGVQNLQANVVNYQNWLADQMDRQGFGRTTFAYETEADGVTPRIHVLRLPEPDSAYRMEDQNDTYDLVVAGARAVGIRPFADGEIWLLVHEAWVQHPDGSKTGGIALGGGFGNGGSGGVAVVDAATLSVLDADGLRDNRSYDGLIIPEYGPYPLKQGISFPSFEGTTVSSVSSSYMGAVLHELLHAFGLPHNFLNDDNFHGSVMGNGLRGWRGYVFPGLYPDDTVSLSRSSAMALNASRFFQPPRTYLDNTAPILTLNGTPNVVNGQVRISFRTSDNDAILAAVLLNGGEAIGQMALSGTTMTATFDTPYYEPGVNTTFTVQVFDASGNQSEASIQYTPPTAGNHAPKPFIRASQELVIPGQLVTLSAADSTDDANPGALTVEWDIDGDGTFDTPPTTTRTFSTQFATPGVRLVKARIRDAAGVAVISEPVPIRVVADFSGADTPSVTNSSTNEDLQTSDGLVISRNAADGVEVTHFKITSITGGTLFQNNGTTAIANGDFITFAQANAGLKFTPTLNSGATGHFTVQAS